MEERLESEGMKKMSSVANKSGRSSSMRQVVRNKSRCCWCLTRGKFPCCCIGPRTSRRAFVIMAIIYDVIISTYFGMVYSLYLFTPTEELQNAMDAFFTIFNPFKGYNERDIDVLSNLMIITTPMVVFFYLKTFLGIRSWISNFTIKDTERYYRISLTYQLYAFIYRFIILVLLKFSLW